MGCGEEKELELGLHLHHRWRWSSVQGATTLKWRVAYGLHMSPPHVETSFLFVPLFTLHYTSSLYSFYSPPYLLPLFSRVISEIKPCFNL